MEKFKNKSYICLLFSKRKEKKIYRPLEKTEAIGF